MTLPVAESAGVYVDNNLVNGGLDVCGRTLDLGGVDQDMCIVSTVDDHIVAWTSSYATLRHVRGDSRLVLSSGGHIAGFVRRADGLTGW